VLSWTTPSAGALVIIWRTCPERFYAGKVPFVTDSPLESAVNADSLRRFFHDVATPLSAVALHLEVANRRAQRGEDPLDAIGTARVELERALKLFETGRASLIGKATSD